METGRIYPCSSKSGCTWDRRELSPERFRFYFADIGKTQTWGRPVKPSLQRNILNYQIAPLFAEQEAFGVYMVDGRWRAACALMAFLRASKHGADPQYLKVLNNDYPHPDLPNYQISLLREKGIVTLAQ